MVPEHRQTISNTAMKVLFRHSVRILPYMVYYGDRVILREPRMEEWVKNRQPD